VAAATVTYRRGADGRLDLGADAPFDVPGYLAAPLVARLATRDLTLHPVWYLWEDQAFWVITGTWSTLERRLAADPAFTLVVDTCAPADGQVRQVIARGRGTVTGYDAERARRKLVRYLGPDEDRWDPRFHTSGPAAAVSRFARLVPDRLRVADLSFRPAAHAPHPPHDPYPST
jgi:hypothetical protein